MSKNRQSLNPTGEQTTPSAQSKDPSQVANMFTRIAGGYDLANDVLSLGLDRYWRRALTPIVVAQEGVKVLDVACGTGTSSAAFAKAGAEVTGADFSLGMLQIAQKRHPNIKFQFADATELPFENQSFDAVTISFGLRNVNQPERALAEFYRVLKPGGRLVICEFSTPTFPPFRSLYYFWLEKVMPLLISKLSGELSSYDYLAKSIQAWPTQRDLGKTLQLAGFEKVRFRNLTGGIVALHLGRKA